MELQRLEQRVELKLVRLQQQQRQLVLRRRLRGLSMPILKLLLVAVAVAALAVANSFVNYLAQQESLVKKDLALYEAICDDADPGKRCAERLWAESVSTVGLLLAAEHRRRERGPLTDADREQIRSEWRRRYEDQAQRRIYPAIANACADTLGDRCPGFIALSSWDYQKRLQRPLMKADTDA